MREIDYRFEPFADGVNGNRLVVYQVDRRTAYRALEAYTSYNAETPDNISFARRSPKRDRIVLSAEGPDMRSGRNIIGFLGVLAHRGRYWPVPSIETLYISPHIDRVWQNKVGSLLLNSSAPINRSREHQVLISNYLDTNEPGRGYLRTHGFQPCRFTDEDRMGDIYESDEAYQEFDHFHEQSKASLLRYIDADLWPDET